MKDKSGHYRRDTLAGDRAMVSAVFRAVATFAKPPKEKLKAVIRAGKIAEAFLSDADDSISLPARDTDVFRRNQSKSESWLSNRTA